MENIINSLAKIIYDKTKKNEFINFDDIYIICQMFINYYSLNDYVKKIYCVRNAENDYYSFEKKTIGINIEHLISFKTKSLNRSTYFKDFESILAINLFIVNSIIHEITHAFQYKKIYNDEVSLETKILLESYDDNFMILNKENLNYIEKEYIRALNDFYNTSFGYRTYPSERMANITATRYENLILEDQIFDKYIKVKEYEKDRLFISYTLGYYNNISPTIYFLNQKKKISENLFLDTKRYDDLIMELKEISKSYSLYEKLYYGLKLNPIENLKLYTKKARM